MMRTKQIALRYMIGAVFVLLFEAGAAKGSDFFPIGAWFPDGDGQDISHFSQVDSCNFNVIHALHGFDKSNSLKQAMLDSAQAHGLKVQLYSWRWSKYGWRPIEGRLRAKIFKANPDFNHQVGESFGTDEWRALVSSHNAGYMINGLTLSVPPATLDNITEHTFFLKRGNFAGSDTTVARLELLLIFVV